MNEICARLGPLLVERALGLADALPEASAAHVAGCPTCRALTEATEELMKLSVPPQRRAPEEGWETVVAGVGKRKTVAKSAEVRPRVTLNCSFCHGTVARDEAVFCAGCLAPHHGDCFKEYGQCSLLGCGSTRTVKGTTGIARPRRPGLWIALVGGALLAGAALQGTSARWMAQRPNAGVDEAARRFRQAEVEQARVDLDLEVARREDAQKAAKARLAVAEARAEGARGGIPEQEELVALAKRRYEGGASTAGDLGAVTAALRKMQSDSEVALKEVEVARLACDDDPARIELAKKKLALAEEALDLLEARAVSPEVAGQLEAARRRRAETEADRNRRAQAFEGERALRQAEVEQARADLDLETARHEDAQKAAKARLAVAEARAESARTGIPEQENRVAMAKELFDVGKISSSELAAATVTLQKMHSDAEIARKEVEVARLACDEGTTRLNLARKKQARAQATLDALVAGFAKQDADAAAAIARIDSTIATLEKRVPSTPR